MSDEISSGDAQQDAQPDQPASAHAPSPKAGPEPVDIVRLDVPARPRRRPRKPILVSALVLALLLGTGAGGVAMYVQSIVLPEPLSFPATTTLLYADGSVLAELGSDMRRTVLPVDKISDTVKQVAVAAEDPDFWSDSGGPIARSVARTSYEISGTGKAAWLRTTVAARKLDDQQSKEQILERFLNEIPFGRATRGIEAAASEYFGKTADRQAPPQAQLTTSEAMVLLAMVRQPEPDPANPLELPGYDPKYSPRAEQNSRARFDEIRASMRDLDYLTPEQADALSYPTNTKPYEKKATKALSQPVGLVVDHVLSELTSGTSPFAAMPWQKIREGGYRIMTTIDPRLQRAVEKAADGTVSGSAMSGQPENLQAAAVVVQPGTGRVLAYYGGKGSGNDFAGVHTDEKGQQVGFGAHPAGSTFMVHTLAAALKAGYSLNSSWAWAPYDLPGRTGDNQIRNASRCPNDRSGACSLLDSTATSLNVPLYAVTVSLGPSKVLEMARDAGIDYMWTDDRVRVDLAGQKDMSAVVPSKFDTVLGIGQYPVTVLDQANAMATYGAGGRRAEAHFVERVWSADKLVYAEQLGSLDQPKVLNQQAVADLDYVLSRNPAAALDGRESAAKTGSWEYNGSTGDNTHAWMVGYTSTLAMAVWIGNQREEQPIRDAKGTTIWGSGLPTTIYREVMNAGHESVPPAAFPAAALAGNVNPPGSVPR